MIASAIRLRRLFFGLWPDDATRDALRRATRPVVRHCGGKTVPPDTFHLTLAFLGNVPDERFEAIVAAAAGIAVEPLALTLERLGYFPAPQVLWIGPAEMPRSLQRLTADIWRSLAAAGLQPDVRPFHPHVTLARKVQSPPELPVTRPVAWRVPGFSLIESDADPEGARYRVVASFPVQA